MKAKYIKSIEIKALWKGTNKRIVWTLNQDVNILSGINGIGKSTIINHFIHCLDKPNDNVTIKLFPEEALQIPYDVIRSFDRPLLHSDLLEKLSDNRVRTELDWQIYKLQKRYLDYQVNIGNRVIEALSKGEMEQASDISKPKKLFQDMLDDLFKDTNKTIDRSSNEIQFLLDDNIISPYALSSGEKQMLVILLTALIEDNKDYVLIMDEPEISLHIDWQKKLIGLIRELNNNVLIILSTHSPALIMDGWIDAVIDIDEISD